MCKVQVHFLAVPGSPFFIAVIYAFRPRRRRVPTVQPSWHSRCLSELPSCQKTTSPHQWFRHNEVFCHSPGDFPGVLRGRLRHAKEGMTPPLLVNALNCRSWLVVFFHRKNLIYDQKCHLCLASWSTTQILPKVLRNMKKQKVLMARRRKFQK